MTHDDRQRPGRRSRPSAAGRAGAHERREGAPAREPRLRLAVRRSSRPRAPGREGHRLRPPDAGRRADYYVSFDNVKVGELQGQGLVKCLGRRREARDRRAQRLADRQQRDAVRAGLQHGPEADVHDGGYDKAADQSVPDWDNQKALTIFEQMLSADQQQDQRRAGRQRRPGQLGDLGDQSHKLEQIPVTGQDATLQGIQNILAGDQCMTVYKAVKKEADAASAARRSRWPRAGRRRRPTATTTTRQEPVGAADPGRGDQGQHQDGHQGRCLKRGEICVGKYASTARRRASSWQGESDGSGAGRRPSRRATERVRA